MATVADVTIGDYLYRLYDDKTARVTLAVGVSKAKTSYGAIQGTVTYQGVTYTPTVLDGTFSGCTNMTTAPAIPSGIKSMPSTFYNCTSLRTAPTLPSGVLTLSYTFSTCTALTAAPAIPTGAHAMSYCFSGCTSLTSAPAIPNGATSLKGTFSGCTALVNPPASIPSSVTSMESTFRNCPSLTGRIRVGSAPNEGYSYCFDGTTEPIVLDVTNQSALATWQRVAATSANGNVTTFYPSDNPAPTGTINATRVASAGSTTSDESGRYVYVQVATTVSTDRAPYNVAQAPTITVDGTTVTPTQTSGTASWRGWVALSDDYAHTIGATPNDVYKSGITVTATLPSTYSPMEFHATGDGASFGKHATRAGVLDVAWDIESDGDVSATNVTASGTITGASVGDANGTLQQLRDSVSLTDAGYVFTPYSGFTTLSVASQRFGSVVMLTVEVKTTTPRAAGQVNVGKWSTPSGAGGLGCARVTATDEKAYEGTCQIAANGEVRFYSSTGNVYKFWGVVWLFLP